METLSSYSSVVRQSGVHAGEKRVEGRGLAKKRVEGREWELKGVKEGGSEGLNR